MSPGADRLETYDEAMNMLRWLGEQLPREWPPELPPEDTPDFWFTACKHEFATRKAISAKMRRLAASDTSFDLSALEAWLVRRRIEWAAQLALAAAQTGKAPGMGLREFLAYLLADSWETDGCQGLWKHAERDGKPHPENPDGLHPLP
ncbi:hypothetical protein OH491_13630 [Termitidicoccus mucosus]|uniref:Uncharacterized protein n=1 Tax=Termitidicoccus mucosus TaxID=1184151 RepID=A0A178IH53_9BACT|nr:hypothetical protein AW736_13820 [Opitutaceae bacterium TSB47]